MKQQSLDQALRQKLTHDNYNNLHMALGHSKNKTTRLINQPENMTADDVRIIAALLGLHPMELVDKYSAGAQQIPFGELEELRDTPFDDTNGDTGIAGEVKPRKPIRKQNIVRA
jgi:hypothetical protein